MNSDNLLDVVVRFHSMERMRELKRALFSIVSQEYRPIKVHIATQRFNDECIRQLKSDIKPLFLIADAPEFAVWNWAHDDPSDARSALVNLALSKCEGHFLSFLDYDDVVYPEAYNRLVEELKSSDVSIAFGGICVKDVDVFEPFDYAKKKRLAFTGNGLEDLYKRNFCPIHSFILRRSDFPVQFLFFEPYMNRAEDYDFLLRVTALRRSSFKLKDTILGDYYYKSDGSNTVLVDSSFTTEAHAKWQVAEDFLEIRRKTTSISFEVQKSLGIKVPIKNLSIHNFLKQQEFLRN